MASQALLRWFQHVTKNYSNVDIQNLTSSFKTGIALLAVIHHYEPSLVPDVHELKPENAEENLKRAFSLAEKHFEIEPFIDPEDLLVAKIEPKSTFTYLQQYNLKLAKRVAGGDAMDVESNLGSEVDSLINSATNNQKMSTEESVTSVPSNTTPEKTENETQSAQEETKVEQQPEVQAEQPAEVESKPEVAPAAPATEASPAKSYSPDVSGKFAGSLRNHVESKAETEILSASSMILNRKPHLPQETKEEIETESVPSSASSISAAMSENKNWILRLLASGGLALLLLLILSLLSGVPEDVVAAAGAQGGNVPVIPNSPLNKP